MSLTLLQKLCGWVLVGCLCFGILTVSGCRGKSARGDSPAPVSVSVSENTESQSVRKQLISAKPIQGDVESFGKASGEAAVSPKFDTYDPGMTIVEAERLDRRERARNLAETRIDRAKIEMELASASRLESRRREMQAEHDTQFREMESKITADYVNHIREVDLQLQAEQMNLHLKMAALKSRQGMFGGKIDTATSEALDRLKEQQEQLDKRRAESVQSAKDRRDWEIAEVSHRLRSEMEHSLGVLQVELDSRLADQSRSLHDRLEAQMSGGGARGSSAANRPSVSVERITPTSRDFVSAHNRAVGDADGQFEKDFARAVATAKERLKEARQRDSEDAALVARISSGT